MPLVMGESESIREIAVSTPSLIHGPRAGLRVTITSRDWSLILAPKEGPTGLEEAVYTMIVDGIPRVLRPFGKIDTELYNLSKDPRQERNLIDQYPEVATRLHRLFIDFLKELGASDDIIRPWLRCKRLHD